MPLHMPDVGDDWDDRAEALTAFDLAEGL